MVILKLKSKFIPVKMIFFAGKPSLKEGLFTTYRSASSSSTYFFFVKEEINTLINTLKLSDVELLRSFRKNTVYEINRSIRDKMVEIDLDASLDDFIPLYNKFGSNRDWRNFKIRDVMLDKYHITVCRYQGKVIIAHLYFLDSNSKRVCLESSVSDIDNASDNQLKALIGRSNRHLHYADMLRFKNLGFERYDFGGYDNHHKNNKKKSGINRFKEGFRGAFVYESNYTSYPLHLLFLFNKAMRLFKGIKAYLFALYCAINCIQLLFLFTITSVNCLE
jgi:lipid II:glycine glycyltransferase (peptidoglycan interpeptide bridge formation enzyme)